MSGPRVPGIDDDVAAYLTVRLHANGMISVSGHVGDPKFACQLLDHAKDAVRRNVKDVIIPNRDVDVSPALPLTEWGDMAPGDRGDP